MTYNNVKIPIKTLKASGVVVLGRKDEELININELSYYDRHLYTKYVERQLKNGE